MTANIKSDVGLLLDEIYELIDIPNALAELEPKDRGKYYELKCPNCEAEIEITKTPTAAHSFADGFCTVCGAADVTGLEYFTFCLDEPCRG